MKNSVSPPAVPLEILLIEDNPRDAEMAMRALKKNHLANQLVWVKDGAEAIDYIFGRPGICGASFSAFSRCLQPASILVADPDSAA